MALSNAPRIVAALAITWVMSGCAYGDGKGASLDPAEFIATAGLPDDLRLELPAELAHDGFLADRVAQIGLHSIHEDGFVMKKPSCSAH